MLEKVVGKQGHVTLRWEGRLLASSVDPHAEAQQWLAQRMTLLESVQSIIVLGAGAGYHIAQLVRTTKAQLLVIDRSHDLIEAVKELQSLQAPRVQFECLDRATMLRNSVHIKQAVSKSFVVLSHSPSVACEPELYKSVHAQLIGRDWGSLNWQWTLKGLPPLNEHMRIERTGPLLTICDLEKTEFVQNAEGRERMLIKALRELVK